MVKEEYLIIIVLVLQSVNMLVSLKRVIRSRCTSVWDIEKSTEGTRNAVTLDR